MIHHVSWRPRRRLKVKQQPPTVYDNIIHLVIFTRAHYIQDQESPSLHKGGDGSVSGEGQEEAKGEGGGSEEASYTTTGFGGIKVSSVEDIIAKARVVEAFINIPNAGLSGGSLSELAVLASNEQQESDDITTGNSEKQCSVE